MAEFDKYGRWINPNYQSRPVSSFTSTYRSASRRRNYNIWGRLNDFIANIGDWIDDNAEALSNNCSVGFYFLAWIGLVIGVIGQWISSSFWSALLTAVVGGVIVYYAAAIGMFILMYALRGFLFVVRYVFYNIYTLLIAIAIVVALVFYNQINIPQNRPIPTSNTVSYQPNYYCDVNTTLNVREYPRSNARVIGQLKRYEEVYVYSIDGNNFAKIRFKGGVAYVSASYLKKKN